MENNQTIEDRPLFVGKEMTDKEFREFLKNLPQSITHLTFGTQSISDSEFKNTLKNYNLKPFTNIIVREESSQ